MKLSIGLPVLLGILSSAIWGQQTPGSANFITATCKRSLVQLDLPSQYVYNMFVTFSALDQYGRSFEISDELARQCGYATTWDPWGNIKFRASLLSCYAQISDVNSTLTMRIDISPNPDKSRPVTYIKQASCPYVWNAREILCEVNYMEVSVRRKIPMIAESAFPDEPEDWSSAFPEAVAGLVSIWQVVFHLSSTRKAMLVSDAQKTGYGINTTESRILLRAPYKTAEAQLRKFGNVNFSVVRSTIFYKQRWVILLVDSAVACPVDDINYTTQMITWSVPKSISPLLIGSSSLKSSQVAFGVDLLTLTNREIINRNYVVIDNPQVTMVTVPIGASGGYYKSHVLNGTYGITYSINVFLEHTWEDNVWGVTKYTIIKDITTPFDPRPPAILNETVPATKKFNVSIGTFLADVQLVNVTVGLVTLTVQQLTGLNYISSVKHPNGSISFRLIIPFTDPIVTIQFVGDTTRAYVLNVTFGFNIIPNNETFISSIVIVTLVRDAVLPEPSGYCDQNSLNVIVKRGNVDANWVPYVQEIPLNQSKAQPDGISVTANSTHYTISVYRFSSKVMFEKRLNISCKYTTNKMLVVQYGYENPPTPGTQAKMGTITLVLRLSKDNTYSTFYNDTEYPVVKHLMEPLYFEVELLYSVDPQLELFLEYCWATASPDKTSFPKWNVVDNSCEFKETHQTIFHPVTADSRVKFPSHLKRFEVKMFTFMDGNRTFTGQIYFHCSAIICNAKQLFSDPLCTKSCIPSRQRMGRSVELVTERHKYVSSGAVVLKSGHILTP
ncbi:hypothetical protein GDO86_010452 [Hymenochirus boettgeri]|uniref:ZP domain-containing protein n=1 Tax=Hymenochirus boettgeri TaxID=247094 RepID=A0A8T2JKJ4_9PIPI|nr:hypothetical protein GDO86_010452 [Hymenochirus boettgeri]